VLEQPASMIDAFRIFQGELDAILGPDRPVTATELTRILAAVYGARR
jgi:hypothetical protein